LGQTQEVAEEGDQSAPSGPIFLKRPAVAGHMDRNCIYRLDSVLSQISERHEFYIKSVDEIDRLASQRQESFARCCGRHFESRSNGKVGLRPSADSRVGDHAPPAAVATLRKLLAEARDRWRGRIATAR
jgi:hypothetical protein